MAALAVVQVELAFTPRAAALLRDLLEAIRAGNPWEYQELLGHLEPLEPLLRVHDAGPRRE